MKFLSDLLVQGDGNEIFLKSADHNISRIIPRGTGANLDKGLFSLYDTGTEDVRIDTAGNSWFNGGNVGIGTTAPDSKLSVTSTTLNSEDILYLKSGADNVNDYLGIAWELGVGGNGPHSAIRSFAGPSGSDARLGFLTTSDGGTTLTEGLSVAHNGNVGIGTTSPGNTLHVYKNATIGVISSPTVANAGLRIQDSGANMYVDGNSFVISASGYLTTTGSNDFDIGTNSTSRIKIKGDGNVGIGTTSPNEKLTVAGNIHAYAPSGINAGLFASTAAGATSIAIRSSGVTFFNAGNVGIGTNSPSQKLHVAGKGLFTDFVRFNGVTAPDFPVDIDAVDGGKSLRSTRGTSVFRIDQGNDGPGYIGMQSADDFSIQTNNTSKIYITSAGNVGIGTTSPAYKLDINGDFRVKDGSSAIAFNEYSNGATIWLDGSNGDFAGGDYFNISAYGTTDLAFGYAAGTKITMKSDGKLGIGTTSPSTALEVIGDIKIKQESTYSNYSLIDASEALLTLSTYTVNASAYPADIKFSPNQTERMRITDDGNVGIGTTSPDQKLHIIGTSSDTAGEGLFAIEGDAGNVSWVFRSTDTGDNLAIDREYGGAGTYYNAVMLQRSTGNVGIGTDSPDTKLHVSGSIKAEGNGTDQYFFEGVRTGVGTTIRIYDNANTAYIDSYNNMAFRANQNGGSGGNFRFTGGNVGIGTTSPDFTLDVAGHIGIDGNIYHNGDHNTYIGFSGDTLTFRTGGDDRLILTNTTATFGGDVSLADSKKLKFGAGNDLQIYHDGSNSYINDIGTGDLYIRANNLRLQNADGSGQTINTNNGGNVELFHNNSKKFETTSTGVAVTGKITNLTAGTGNLDAVNVQQLNNATTGTLIYKGTWSAAPTTTSVLDGAVSGGTIVIEAANPGISVGATITGTGISGTVTVSNIAADGITIAISSSQTIADGTTLTFTTVGGTPDLSQASRKVTGHYYICETAGAATPNGAGTTPNEWAVGDWATFSDLTTDAWQKIDNSSVLSGAGTGGKVPVWSGTGTSVTLADAPITVSGNNATFAGDVSLTGGSLSISGDGSNAVTFTETGAGKMTVSAADDIILDAGSDIVLDAGGDDLRLKVSGTEYAKFNNSSSNLNIFSSIQDKAIKFIGNDNGTEITALTLNMADGGDATFAGAVLVLRMI